MLAVRRTHLHESCTPSAVTQSQQSYCRWRLKCLRYNHSVKTMTFCHCHVTHSLKIVVRFTPCSVWHVECWQLGADVPNNLLGAVRSEGRQDGGTRRGVSEPIHRISRLHRVRCLQLGSSYCPAQYADRYDDSLFRQNCGISATSIISVIVHYVLSLAKNASFGLNLDLKFIDRRLSFFPELRQLPLKVRLLSTSKRLCW